MTLWRLGWEGVAATRGVDLTQMVLAGCWNAGAFYSLTRALKLAPVFYVNAVNASQIAMAGLVGVWLFGEAPSASLAVGIILTTVALLTLSRK